MLRWQYNQHHLFLMNIFDFYFYSPKNILNSRNSSDPNGS